MPGIVPLSQLVAAVGQSTFVQTILSILQQLNFPVTSWRSGDPSNTMVQSQATISASFSTQVATLAAGGFLDYAATVTPDPSVTPGVAPGWLDVLASSVYNVQNGSGGPGRIAATFANGQQSFTNTSGSPSGPYPIGTFHLSQANGSTYHNTQSLTIATGTNSYPFAADVAGAPSSAGPGVITGFVTPIPGITTTNPAAFVGVNAESNPNLVSRCRAKLGSLSPNGPKLAYDYVARTIPLPAPLVALSSGLLTTPGNPVNRTKLVTVTATGSITLYVASAAGPYVAPNNYTGSASLAITGVTNVAAPVITVASHGYTTGDQIFISGTGLSVIDGSTWTITVLTSNTFSIPSGAPGGTSSTGFAYRQSDLDLIDKTVQTYCIPNAIGPYQTLSAPQNMIRISATCTLKRGSVLTPGQVSAAGLTALASYFANLPLGGDNKGGASFFFIEPMGVAITNAFPNDIINVTFAAPGITADVPVVTPQDVPLLNPASAILSVYEL